MPSSSSNNTNSSNTPLLVNPAASSASSSSGSSIATSSVTSGNSSRSSISSNNSSTTSIGGQNGYLQHQENQLNLTGITTKNINDSYQVISKIGEGISGSVYKAIKKDTNQMVALKNFKGWTEKDRASREECSLLIQLRHIPYITPIIDICTNLESSEQVIVFPYFEHDLSGLLSENRLSIPQVKCYFLQLLEGIDQVHKSGVMHRDIKAANILINNKGSLFIGDLGTATSYLKRSVFSSKVVTLWYRAPELLLGATQYGPEVDMWSVGCVLIELVTSRNFLPGSSEQQQLEAICKLCGTPSEENWAGVSNLANYNQISHLPLYPSKLRTVFKNFSNDFLELLEGLLTLNPKKRLTAEQALASPFFTNQPLPYKPENMPGYQPIHVLEAVQKRMQQQEIEVKKQQEEEQIKNQEFLRKQEELKKQQLEQQQQKQEEQMRLKLKQQQEEQLRKQQEQIKKQQQEEQKKLEQQKRQQELKRQQDEFRKQQEEIKKQQELKKQQEELIKKEQQQSSNITIPANTHIFNQQSNNNQQQQQQQQQQQIDQDSRNNLKRSLDLVDDIRNYECETESECEYHSQDEEDFLSDVDQDDLDEEEEEDDDEDSQDEQDFSSDDEDYYQGNGQNSNTIVFTHPINAFIQPKISDSSNVNPFLQPPKKQRTTTPTTFSSNSLSTPLIIH
ncbi:hypothetical protein CYY_006278 [Polysphondylium violaceum]|uniref:cyclin-dependent kinase n=1 Tax=Polysphondylium violaceum TaxID=133409 RepID=A0A8J4UZ32_9MYCE|nr:hypothetical protein CYY_006278 [Polysphondylium violaceum]